MTAEQFGKLLRKLEACEEAAAWANGKTLSEAWDTCERGDWMLWLAGRMINKKGWPSHKKLVLAACDCAELSLPFIPEGEDRPGRAIKTARKWAHGKASAQEVRNAARVGRLAHAVAYTATATSAAHAAANTAYAYAAYAAYAAANAATDAAYAARSAAHVALTRQEVLKQCADIVREQLRPRV